MFIYQSPDSKKRRLSCFEYFHNGYRPFDPAAHDGLIALFRTHTSVGQAGEGRNE